MKLEQRMVGDVVIVTVMGDISLDHDGNVALKDAMRRLLQQGHRKLLLDLGEVPYMDSAGLGEMVQAYLNTKKGGGSLRLLRVSKRLRNLLVVTKLLTVFDTYDSDNEALSSFGVPSS